MKIRSVSTIVIALLLPYFLIVASASARQMPKTSNHHSKPQSPKPEKKSDRESNLDFSGTGRPGQQTAGESRSGCIGASQPIEAMLPESNTGKTVLSHPSFWVYFPKIANQKTEIEFVIQNESREDIWRSRSALNSTASYQNFSLPETEAPLEVGQWYRWYVKVYCQDRVASAQYVQGWVNRVPLTSKLYVELQEDPQKMHLAYANNSIWYDAVDELLSLHYHSPQNIALIEDWKNLIQAKGVDLDELPCTIENLMSHHKI